MIAPLLYSFFIAIMMGFFFMHMAWPAKRPLPFTFCVSSASGLGLGLSSCFYFLWLVAGGYRIGFPLFCGIEAALVMLLAILSLHKIKGRIGMASQETAGPALSDTRLLPLFFCLFLTGIAVTIIAIVVLSVKLPHGDWDAWSIWNMRARFLFRDPYYWKNAFSSVMSWSHPDYPLLVPATVARGWGYAGKDILPGPAITALLFSMSTAFLLSSALMTLRSKAQGLLGGSALVAVTYFSVIGASQYADMPTSFFYLAAMVSIAFYDLSSCEDRRPFLFLAGINAGLAMWTKNEGSLFMAALLAARFLAIVPAKGFKVYMRELAVFFAGAMPLLATFFYFKVSLAPANDLLVSVQAAPLAERLTDPSRYFMIADAFIKKFGRFGYPFLGAIPALFIYAFLAGVRVTKENIPSAITSFLTVSFMVAGYFCVYLITPYDLEWHFNTSLNRLIFQLWPITVFSFFMITTEPEYFLGKGAA